MVGLSVVLETSKKLTRDSGGVVSPKPPQVLNKTAVIIPAASSPSVTGLRRQDPGFLEHCSLCKKKLLHGKDIYMYKGGTFCTEECRSRQIFMDEEESLRGESYPLIATVTTPSDSTEPSTYLPASSGYSQRRR